MVARELVPTPGPLQAAPDPSLLGDSWLPRLLLSYEESGVRSDRRSTSSLFQSRETPQDEEERISRPIDSTTEAFHRQDAALPPEPTFRFRLNAWDIRVASDPKEVCLGEGVSGTSGAGDPSSFLDPFELPLEGGISLGIHFDLLGFEEVEGTRQSPIDSRHVTPGIGNLSTGLGISIRF
jgi:hypothetical protein